SPEPSHRMPSSRDEQPPAHRKAELRHKESAICSTMSSLLSGPTGGRLTNPSSELLFFGSDTKRLRNLHTGLRFNNPRLRLPGLCVGHRVVNRKVEVNGVAVNAMIALDRSHLLAVRLA